MKIKGAAIFLICAFAICYSKAANSYVSRDTMNIYLRQHPFWKQDSNAVDRMNEMALSYYHILNEPDSAFLWHRKGLQLAEKLNYKTGIGDAYYIEGLFYIGKDDDSKASENFMKAIEIYSLSLTNRSIIGLSKVYMQQAVLDYKLNHFKEAIKCIDQGINILTQHNLEVLTVFIYLKGVFLVEDGQYRNAIPFLEEAMRRRLIERNERYIMEVRIYTAEAYGKTGRYQDAAKLFRLSKNYARKMGDSDAISMTYMKEGKFFLDYKKYKEAEEDFLVAVKYIPKGDRGLKARQLLAQVYSLTHRYEDAYRMLTEYIKVENSMKIADLDKQLASLRIRSDLVKSEAEIELLEQKNKNDRLVNYGLTIVSVLILITAIISYKRFTFKRDANRKLSQANQELMQTLEDLQLAEQQLLQAEKMASLGRVTAGIAHELRNPLNFIHNFAAVASDTVEDFIKADPAARNILADDLKTSIEKIKFHGSKADQIITTMLRHGKEKILDTEAVSLNELIDESIAIATKNFSFKHEGFQCNVDHNSGEDDVRIRVNPKSIPLVIGNLIDNAMYSVMQKFKMNSNGYIPSIKLQHVFVDKGLLLEIEDNGLGLTQTDGNEIFEPFYTTKPAGHGTGLGLSICYEILKAHGASISVKNNFIGGATFSIIFPTATIIN